MGQKINPIIFRLNKTSDWKSQYFEKKSTESAVYNFKDIEIKKFVRRFFECNGLTVYNLKLAYFDNTLHLFVSYFSTLKTTFLVSDRNKKQNFNLIRKKINDRNQTNYVKIKNNIRNYIKYKELNYTKILKKSTENQSIVTQEKTLLKLRRVKFLKYYKNYLATKQYKNISNIKYNFFLTKLFESLSGYIGPKIGVSLTLNKLNNNIKQKIHKKNLKILKKDLIKLRRYEKNKFFKEGVNVLFLSVTKKNSACLLATFLAEHLGKLKRHNFFLRFIKNTLVLFNTKTLSNIEGIKIKIKGRFNKAPRARHRIIEIGNGVQALTLKSEIDYSTTTAFTHNGTLGVKVWISQKN